MLHHMLHNVDWYEIRYIDVAYSPTLHADVAQCPRENAVTLDFALYNDLYREGCMEGFTTLVDVSGEFKCHK